MTARGRGRRRGNSPGRVGPWLLRVPFPSPLRNRRRSKGMHPVIEKVQGDHWPWRTTPVRQLMALLLAAATTACSASATKLEVSGSGKFPCPSFHGCIAWLVIRPVDWSRTADWEPGRGDAQFATTFEHGIGDDGVMVVDGRLTGGPSVLEPGEYRFSLLHSEVDDTEPLVLGTDEEPTRGIIRTTLDCDRIYRVSGSVAALGVYAVFGPNCTIEFQPK